VETFLQDFTMNLDNWMREREIRDDAARDAQQGQSLHTLLWLCFRGLHFFVADVETGLRL
jgi:hypothetical protein